MTADLTWYLIKYASIWSLTYDHNLLLYTMPTLNYAYYTKANRQIDR